MQIDVSVNAPQAGTIKEFLANEEDTVTVGQDLVKLELGGEPSGGDKQEAKQEVKEPASSDQGTSSQPEGETEQSRPEEKSEPKKQESKPEPKQESKSAPAPSKPTPPPKEKKDAEPKKESAPGSREERRVSTLPRWSREMWR
jgi:2-oxoglutarate dehydrogenase E2 component (dihydrolipoamide succinyltransferase)